MFRKKGKYTKIKCMQFKSKEECLKGKEMDGRKESDKKIKILNLKGTKKIERIGMDVKITATIHKRVWLALVNQKDRNEP